MGTEAAGESQRESSQSQEVRREGMYESCDQTCDRHVACILHSVGFKLDLRRSEIKYLGRRSEIKYLGP